MLADLFNTHVHCHEQWTHTRHFAKHMDSQGSQVKPDISFEGRGWEWTAGTPGVHHGGILGFKSGRMKKLDQSRASCLPYVCIVLAVGKEWWGWTRKSVRGREIRKRGAEWRWLHSTKRPLRSQVCSRELSKIWNQGCVTRGRRSGLYYRLLLLEELSPRWLLFDIRLLWMYRLEGAV